MNRNVASWALRWWRRIYKKCRLWWHWKRERMTVKHAKHRVHGWSVSYIFLDAQQSNVDASNYFGSRNKSYWRIYNIWSSPLHPVSPCLRRYETRRCKLESRQFCNHLYFSSILGKNTEQYIINRYLYLQRLKGILLARHVRNNYCLIPGCSLTKTKYIGFEWKLPIHNIFRSHISTAHQKEVVVDFWLW